VEVENLAEVLRFENVHFRFECFDLVGQLGLALLQVVEFLLATFELVLHLFKPGLLAVDIALGLLGRAPLGKEFFEGVLDVRCLVEFLAAQLAQVVERRLDVRRLDR
jgi:hypothetical protein